MKVKRFEWEGAVETARDLRDWAKDAAGTVDVQALGQIWDDVVERRDTALIELTNRFDAIERGIKSVRVEMSIADAALAALKADLRSALELAAANIRTVAEVQSGTEHRVELPQGQVVTLREVPVLAAGIYAPGGRAAYPSSVLMCAIPARVAGVEWLSLASPPRADGTLHPLVLAAAALCEVDEIYAMGGAQAVVALAFGTETVTPVDVVAGPGNAWVRDAKRAAYGMVGIDSLAGPSELMLIAGPGADPEWAALDLCAQAEHGPDSPLAVVASDEPALEEIVAAAERAAGERPGVADAPMALVLAPSLDEAANLANAFAPEHLELLVEDAAALAEVVTTAGCVFVGPRSATAFGDYIAGSNHVLPTGGAGRFSGPLGPHVFRRKISTVEVSAEAAAKLAPHVDVLARAEGFPVHAESAMIRAEL